jgi:DHA2 family multidrug resistance protein
MSDEAGTADAAPWSPQRSAAGGHNPYLIAFVVSIATFMEVLDTTIANVALRHIAGGLAVGIDESTYVITSYLVANAIVLSISGWLSTVIGRKRFYMICVAIFTLASLLCGLAWSLESLVLFRIVQGLGGGGMATSEQAILADSFPPHKRGQAFAIYGIAVVVAPVIGPTLGGWITDTYSWHWVFLINVPIGILSLVLVSLFVDEPAALKKRTQKARDEGFKIDFVGFLLIALALGCLEVTLDRGQRDDWFSSATITSFAIVAGFCFLAFIPWELSRTDPIVNIKLFGNRNFVIANIFMLLMGLIVFGTTQFIPQLLQEVMGYTATNAGLALTMGGLVTLLVMPLAGFLTGKVDSRWLVGFALLVQGIAMWNLSTLDTQMSFGNAAVARMIQSVALPFLFVPITNIAYVGIKPEENNQASALMNVARNLGGTFGISLVQTMLARQSQVHQAQYVETLNPLNPNYTNGIHNFTSALMAQGLSPGDANTAATAELYRRLGQQAQMLSYIDIFHILMWVVFLVLPLVLLLQKPKGHAGAAA